MQVYLLSESFDVIRIIDRATHLSVIQRFFSPGEFTLRVPGDADLPNDAAYFYDPVSNVYALIEGMRREENGELTLSGRTLEALLERRRHYASTAYSGDLQTSVRIGVWRNAIKERGIAGLELGSECELSVDSNFKGNWDVLSEWAYSSLKPYGASYTIKYNTVKRIPEFAVTLGVDRTSSQSAVTPVIFSEKNGDIKNVSFAHSAKDHYNMAYVVGYDGASVTVPDTLPEGLERHELLVRASDLAPDDFYTETEYTDALKRRGNEKLALCADTVTISGDLTLTEHEVGRNYKLGDICEVVLKDGSSYPVRVTSVKHVYSGGTRRITASFGDDDKTLRDIIRDEAEKYATDI